MLTTTHGTSLIVNPVKLELAKTFGATDTVIGGNSAVSEVIDLSHGGVDFAFEVAGHALTARQAFSMLRKGGAVILIGAPKLGTDLTFPAIPFLQKEIKVIGCIMGSGSFQIDIPRYAEFYLDGALMLDPLVSQWIALEDINRGYEQLIAGDVARSIIKFTAGTGA